MKTSTLPLLMLLLASCTSFTAYRPNIDLRQVDLNRYEQDMAACEQQSEGLSFSWGNPIAECMANRGYTIRHDY